MGDLVNDFYGLCPVCGQEGLVKHIGKGEFFYCENHKKVWNPCAGMISREEGEPTDDETRAFFADYELVDTVGNGAAYSAATIEETNMKVTIEITGKDKDYTVKATTSEPLNGETRLALWEAVRSLVIATNETDETADKLSHMKARRDEMKARNKTASGYVDELAGAMPVWVGSVYPGGGKAYLGEKDIAKGKAKAEAEAAKEGADSDCIPF